MHTDAVRGRRDDLLPAALLRLASDQRLIEQVRAGSERAFEALFDRHHRPVLTFCRHMLGSREEAEDVVQLTFLAAYRDLGRTEPPAALRPWLYAIARHRCLRVLRARRERPVAEVALPATDRLAAEVAAREDLRAILADVAHLPEDQRAALVLAELGDVSHEEIGRILACPREKVKALVFQARSSLVASRVARETPCADIREQLATLRGGALRRTTLRRHLRDCPACSAFREQIRAQRRALGIVLPVAPGLGLKRTVLGAVFGSGASGAGEAALTAAALSSGGLAAAALVILAIPAGGITAVASALGDRAEAPHVTPTAQQALPASAWPLVAERARSVGDQPGSPTLGRDPEERRVRPTDPGADAPGAGQGQPATGPVPTEPTRPRPDGASEPTTAPAAAQHANPAAAPAPSQADTHPTATAPTTPGRPPQANGRPKPTTRPAPGRPPPADARPASANAAGPGTQPQSRGEATPTTPNGRGAEPPPAAPEAALGPAVAPGAAPHAAAPSSPGTDRHGGGGDQPPTDAPSHR